MPPATSPDFGHAVHTTAGSVTEGVDTGEDDLTALLARFLPNGRLPLPGGGNTLERWRSLAEVASHSLVAAKLFEGHTDALAILAELGADDLGPGKRWAVWAAEPPDARLQAHVGPDSDSGERQSLRLSGRKSWCSGAAQVSHALVTCWSEEGDPLLAAVVLDASGVTVTTQGWHAVGMGPTQSVDVLFDATPAVQIGGPRAYVARPGFWHGGAGIAACWYGGMLPLAAAVARRQQARPDPHVGAHLGAIDTALQSVRALLRETSAAIDRAPQDDARLPAMRLRAAVEAAADVVLWHAGRALGAGPWCRDAALARRYADLPVFLRQSHAEHDLAAIGTDVAASHVASSGQEWAP